MLHRFAWWISINRSHTSTAVKQLSSPIKSSARARCMAVGQLTCCPTAQPERFSSGEEPATIFPQSFPATRWISWLLYNPLILCFLRGVAWERIKRFRRNASSVRSVSCLRSYCEGRGWVDKNISWGMSPLAGFTHLSKKNGTVVDKYRECLNRNPAPHSNQVLLDFTPQCTPKLEPGNNTYGIRRGAQY
jgi:hypothetical protein